MRAEQPAIEHPNCQAVETFLNEFKMALPICKTQNIDEKPVHEGYVAAYYDDARKTGFTVVVWGDGEMLALLERHGEKAQKLVGKTSDAQAFGKQIASVIEP